LVSRPTDKPPHHPTTRIAPADCTRNLEDCMKHDGKFCVVTGAGSGIGEGIAHELAAQGGTVALLDLDPDKAKSVAAALASDGEREHIIVQVDVSSAHSVETAFGAVYDSFGRVDVLVNNAGIADYHDFWELTEEHWDRVFGVNARGTFSCTRAVIPAMREQNYGRIVNISSTGGVNGTPRHSHYSASKAAVIGMSRALAKEVADRNITVNCIAPGLIDTPLSRTVATPEFRAWAIERTPMGHMGEPSDIAFAASFLASDEARFITGQTLSPNGGSVI
jgi:NAD(P)-dependent dehydrogenase (short-subunit alcohol dehydrogenase family)